MMPVRMLVPGAIACLFLTGCAGFNLPAPSQGGDKVQPNEASGSTVDFQAVPVGENAELAKHEQIILGESASFLFQEQPNDYEWDGFTIPATKAPGYTGMTSPHIAAEVLDASGNLITTCRTIKNWRWSPEGVMRLNFECNGNFSDYQKSQIAYVRGELGGVTFGPRS